MIQNAFRSIIDVLCEPAHQQIYFKEAHIIIIIIIIIKDSSYLFCRKLSKWLVLHFPILIGSLETKVF
jgi:hypothetical protein